MEDEGEVPVPVNLSSGNFEEAAADAAPAKDKEEKPVEDGEEDGESDITPLLSLIAQPNP